MTTPAMTPITVTVTARQPTTNRWEIWGAVSRDGTWEYQRAEEPGTPWVVTHVPTGHVEYFGSLQSARCWTNRDDILVQLRRCVVSGAQLALRHRDHGPDAEAIADAVEEDTNRALATLAALAALTA